MGGEWVGGGWVGDQLLIKKLTSPQLSFSAAGTWLSLAKVVSMKHQFVPLSAYPLTHEEIAVLIFMLCLYLSTKPNKAGSSENEASD